MSGPCCPPFSQPQAEDARRRSRIPDLYVGRQVLGIIGVVYGPMCASVTQVRQHGTAMQYGRRDIPAAHCTWQWPPCCRIVMLQPCVEMCRHAALLYCSTVLSYYGCNPAAVLLQAYDEFKKVCRSYSEAFVSRCFVFEPSEEHIRQVGGAAEHGCGVGWVWGRTNDGVA